MSPDKIAIIIAICFLALLFTHYLAIKVGFTMGTKTNPDILMSNPNKANKETYEEQPDIFDEERLDFD